MAFSDNKITFLQSNVKVVTEIDAPGRLAGKIALVTGTAGGIGRATALTLAARGPPWSAAIWIRLAPRRPCAWPARRAAR